jgi:hypothetical protein
VGKRAARVRKRVTHVRQRVTHVRSAGTSVPTRTNALSGRAKAIARPTITISRPTMRAAAPANRSRRRPKRFLWPPLRGAGRRNAFAGAAERSSGRLTRLVGRRTSIGARRTHVVRRAERVGRLRTHVVRRAKRVGRVRTSVVSSEMSRVSCPVDPLGLDIRVGRADGRLESARTRGVRRAVAVVRSREGPERRFAHFPGPRSCSAAWTTKAIPGPTTVASLRAVGGERKLRAVRCTASDAAGLSRRCGAALNTPSEVAGRTLCPRTRTSLCRSSAGP